MIWFGRRKIGLRVSHPTSEAASIGMIPYPSDRRSIAGYLPKKKSIFIAIVRDYGLSTNEWYTSLEKRSNIVASHHLVYNQPVFLEGCKDADQFDEKDHEEIYTSDPRGYYHKYDQTRERLSQDD
jgi:hypothetical protein